MIRALWRWIGPDNPLGGWAGPLFFVALLLAMLIFAPPLIRLLALVWDWTLGPLLGWWWRLWLPGFP
jgi:hypothetical protein